MHWGDLDAWQDQLSEITRMWAASEGANESVTQERIHQQCTIESLILIQIRHHIVYLSLVNPKFNAFIWLPIIISFWSCYLLYIFEPKGNFVISKWIKISMYTVQARKKNMKYTILLEIKCRLKLKCYHTLDTQSVTSHRSKSIHYFVSARKLNTPSPGGILYN